MMVIVAGLKDSLSSYLVHGQGAAPMMQWRSFRKTLIVSSHGSEEHRKMNINERLANMNLHVALKIYHDIMPHFCM
jgi:hypothetical protein